MGDKKKISHVSYPNEPHLVLTMSRQPEHNNFTRYLSFKNHFGVWKRLAIAFKKKRDLIWESSGFPKGIDVLRSFADTGNRNYWDSMYLENRGGRTALPIKHLLIEMVYDKPPWLSPIGIDHERIPIVDADINKTLRSGRHYFSLNNYARISRYKWAGVKKAAPWLVRRVARDLGKSGSDGEGQDRYGKNPKYDARVSHLCSEFASWYYYECKTKVAGHSLEYWGEKAGHLLRDVYSTQQMHDAFRKAKRLYYYKNSDRTWCNVEDLAKCNRYTLKAGDYLERRGPAGAEHSMIMLRWDNTKKEAIVFNGPWPVTLRMVRVEHDEKNKDSNYFVGRVDF